MPASESPGSTAGPRGGPGPPDLLGAEGRPPCTDRARRRLLFAYSTRSATQFEAHAFECHLLECDACYQDLAAVLRFSAVLDEWTAGSDGTGGALRTMLRSSGRKRRVRTTVAVVASFGLGCLLGATGC